MKAMVMSICWDSIFWNIDTRQKSGHLGYQLKSAERALSVKNLSTGLKTFVILKTLLTNGTIETNGTVILDEPEIHLHPEWQLLFAELIVLLNKWQAFNILPFYIIKINGLLLRRCHVFNVSFIMIINRCYLRLERKYMIV